ncbi:hypothetical protein ACFWVU_31160 [Streptomyces sp. NPDC058686]|uniref:hypothetical protein n=1 Tax=Streptomyces sp. NPDC058686 TaxID=3346599 RepID=UPI003655DB9A
MRIARNRPDGTGTAELDLLTHLCGQTPQQLSDPLGRLSRSGFLPSWHDVRSEGEVLRPWGRSPATTLDGRSRDHSCRA